MTSMAITIPAGVLLLLLLYMLFYRFTPLNAKQSGLVISLLAMAIYFPIALIYWPGADVLAMNITVFFMAAYLLGMLFSHREKIKMQDDPALHGKWFHWGPAIIVGFFAVILIVDAVFVTVSKEGLPGGLQDLLIPERMQSQQVETRFPGVMYNNYHKKEAKYNQYLHQLDLLKQRGWQVRKGWLQQTPIANEPGIFQLVIEDASGTAITDIVAGGRFMRASDSRHDIVFSMQEKTPGVYQSELRLPDPGLWHVNINFTHAGESFELHASTNILKAAEK
jgi:nitrogen fixation protein FixH